MCNGLAAGVCARLFAWNGWAKKTDHSSGNHTLRQSPNPVTFCAKPLFCQWMQWPGQGYWMQSSCLGWRICSRSVEWVWLQGWIEFRVEHDRQNEWGHRKAGLTPGLSIQLVALVPLSQGFLRLGDQGVPPGGSGGHTFWGSSLGQKIGTSRQKKGKMAKAPPPSGDQQGPRSFEKGF